MTHIGMYMLSFFRMEGGIMQKEISNQIFMEIMNLNTILYLIRNIFMGGNEFRYFDIKVSGIRLNMLKRIDYAPSKLQCLSVSLEKTGSLNHISTGRILTGITILLFRKAINLIPK
jgi:hypothetical protein